MTPQTSSMEATTPELGPVGLWSPKSSTFSGSDSIVVDRAVASGPAGPVLAGPLFCN